MFTVVGTVPDGDFPLVSGTVSMDGDRICIRGHSVPVNRGTPALLAAAARTCDVLNLDPPVGYLAGDIGKGTGSRRLYETLAGDLAGFDAGSGDSQTDTVFDVLAFHYLQPDVDWHNRILLAMEKMRNRPVLIADAGFMYAAKMSGFAAEYDLFTPDAGELAFLADEAAPHPFYTRGFILHEENRIPELIARAYEHENAARCLLVKGKTDYVADGKQIHATIDSPAEEAMEAMGGTGDTLVGIVAALVGTGMAVIKAATLAAKVNRWAGHYARPTPATQVIEIINQIPRAVARVIRESEIGDIRRYMDNTIAPGRHQISPDMTVLDVVSRYEATQKVFKGYDTKAGECICCRSLFETLETVVEKYGLDMEKFMADLAAAVE